MDIVTQGLLGSALALSVSNKDETRRAAAIGFCAALLADADVLINSPGDALVNLEFHRHFTHALIFIPVGALIAALLLWPLLRKRLDFKRIYLFSLLGYATSGLLDACTSYGTHLLWPFSDGRIAWSIIAIVDPLFSIFLLVSVVWGLKRYSPGPARVGLALAGAYLLLGVWQHHDALQVAEQLARERGHQVERAIVKPTIANLLLWRSIYEADGVFHVDAIRLGLFGPDRVYAGASASRFDAARDRSDIAPDSLLARDVERFTRLSDGFVIADPARDGVLLDIRYSMLPISLTAMWGIDLNTATGSGHASFSVYRDRPENMRELFLAMLLGRDLPPPR